jgi:hypothetical protein
VFSFAVSLAMGVIQPALPVSSPATDATVEVCFAPEDDCAGFAERASGIEPLAAAGVPVWIDDRARMAHAKTMVIDGAMTLQGSYNWTRGAAENSEDLNLISSPTVAAAYSAHWRQRLAVSVPFVDREDWCRPSSAELH